MNSKEVIIKLRIYIIIIVFFVTNSISGQDISFDQYHKAPTYLNPALTGIMTGNYRINALYHSQWSGQLNTGINAFIAGGDVKFELGKSGHEDLLGIGLSFLNDEYNEFNLATRSLQLNTSYHKLLDAKKNQYLGIGIQLGINQKNIDYENLSFEDQFNQLDGYTFTSGEELPQNNYGYFDFATGIFFSAQPNSKLYYNFGVSYNHINGANISLYQNVRNPVTALEQLSRIHSKINIHTSFNIAFSERLFLIPDLLFQKQGSHQNIILGTRVRFALNYEEINNTLSIGTRLKLSKNIDNSNLSAIILLMDYKLKNTNFGFSYNIMLDPFVKDQLGFNIFEFSIKYTGIYNNDDYYCPEF